MADIPNLGDNMVHRPTLDEGESPITIQRGGAVDPTAIIKAATGLDIDPSALTPTSVPAQSDEDTSGIRMLTPEEASQLGPGVKIDVDAEAAAQRNAKADQMVAKKGSMVNELLGEVLSGEQERLERHEEALSDPDKYREIMAAPDGSGPSKTVKYVAPMNDSDGTSVPRTDMVVRETDSAIGDDELLPSYSDDDEPEESGEPKKKARPEPTGDALQDDKAYQEWIKSLQTVHSDEPKDESIITTVRNRTVVESVPGKAGSPKILGDQAFLNSINKFKKDNFRTVSVPLVNSGFVLDMVGTSSVDLTLLYSSVDENTSAVDYEVEKMKTIFKNVVGTHPKIDSTKLRNMIHFMDYQLMAYAHMAATLDEVETIHECDECGNDFHVLANTSDLLLNMPELRDRMNQIRTADSINDYSLLAMDQKVDTDRGFEVLLGHPSYHDHIQYLSDLRALGRQLNPFEVERIKQLQGVLPYIRKIRMPNNTSTNSLYQRYLALTMLVDDELDMVGNEVKKMVDKVLTPQFGVRSVRCPHCGKMHADIKNDSLNDLLFFHFTVNRLTKRTDQKSDNG